MFVLVCVAVISRNLQYTSLTFNQLMALTLSSTTSVDLCYWMMLRPLGALSNTETTSKKGSMTEIKGWPDKLLTYLMLQPHITILGWVSVIFPCLQQEIRYNLKEKCYRNSIISHMVF